MTDKCEGYNRCECCNRDNRCQKDATFVGTNKDAENRFNSFHKFYCNDHFQQYVGSKDDYYRYTWWKLLE